MAYPHSWTPSYQGYDFAAAYQVFPVQEGDGRPSWQPGSSTQNSTGHGEADPSAASYTYYVRMINPKKKSDFVVRLWHDATEKFHSPAGLRLKLMDSFPNDVPSTTDFQIGFFEPPNNTKRWLVDQRDLDTMYSRCHTGAKMTLWCERRVSGMPENSTSDRENELPAPKKTKREQTEADTDEAFQQLREKHPKMEGPKLRLWAKLIQSGRHESYDTPPQIPLITGAPAPAKPKKDSFAEALTGAVTTIAQALQPPKVLGSPVAQTCSGEQRNKVSPLKKTTIRCSCLEDLKKLKELLEDGVLTETEFTEEKQQILTTLKSLK